MARAIKLLQLQLFAYWRKSFSKRGGYDKFSFILILIILLVGYRFIVLLDQTAKSLPNGKTGDLNLLLGIVFFIWILPAFESKKSTGKLANFLFLPLTKNQFSLISLANIFLVPTSIIALIISFSILYPLAFSPDFVLNVVFLFFFSLFSAFTWTLFARLLKFGFFRLSVFLGVILLAFFFNRSDFSSVFRLLNLGNVWLFGILSIFTFFLAIIAIRQTISLKPTHQITPQWSQKIRLPMKFGEMIKKDFFAAWKVLDCYISLLISIIYLVIFFSSDVSVFSCSLVIFLVVMMCASLAFNIFGLENAASWQRLSLLPIKAEDLFIAKNKSFALLIFSQTFFFFPLIFYKFGAVYLLIAILKTTAVILFFMAWGNNLSVRFPFKMNFYEISLGGSLQDIVTALFTLGLLNVLPDFFLMQNAPAVLLINLILVVGSYYIYKLTLFSVGKKLFDEWDNIGFKLQS